MKSRARAKQFWQHCNTDAAKHSGAEKKRAAKLTKLTSEDMQRCYRSTARAAACAAVDSVRVQVSRSTRQPLREISCTFRPFERR